MIILTGANGQVGSAIQSLAQQQKISLIGLGRQACDISDEATVRAQFEKHQPQFLINAAAYTAVDLAETQVEAAMQINADAPGILAKVCKDFDCTLIHLSTDYVFDGNLDRAYREEDEVNPMSVYGRSKWQGEQAIQQIWEKHIILRVSWVFGEQGKNFVKTILRLAQTQPELKIVNDQHGCPTSAESIAEVIFQLCHSCRKQESMVSKDGTLFGIYHYCDQPVTTWYEFAQNILHAAKIEKNILPIKTAEFPTPAKRPKNSELDCAKIEEVFQVERFCWKDRLQEMLE